MAKNKVYIVIPEDIELKNPDGTDSGYSRSFVDWVREGCLMDPKMGKSTKTLYLGMDMRTSIENLEPGDVWELTREEWEVLKDVANNPSNPYVPVIAYQLVAFFDAINEAPDKDPRVKKED